MNYNFICPVCHKKEQLQPFRWGSYRIIHCGNCALDYCGEMIKKERGAASSPVDQEGIEMMSKAFYNTQKLAMSLARKRKIFYEKVLKRKCKKILDVGCGPGVFYNSWEKLGIKWNGIEVNPYWEEFGVKNRIPITTKSIDSLSGEYDVVVAHQVIEHIEDPISFMNSIKILLKPKGIVHLELPNQNSFTSRLRQISSKLSYDYGFIQPPMHLRAYRDITIKNLFNKLELNPILVFTCSNTDKTWGQVRDYNIKQKSIYTLTGKIGMGSLLIGLGQVTQ